MKEKINHPKYYNLGTIEVVDAIVDWGLNFCMGNVIKYVARYRHKDDSLEDLKKARWYLDYEIRKLEEAKLKLEDGEDLHNSLSIFNKDLRVERG
jgi:hypothetical protein